MKFIHFYNTVLGNRVSEKEVILIYLDILINKKGSLYLKN